MSRRTLEQRLEALESALYERISPLTPAEVSSLVREGHAAGLSDEEIIARMEERDPAACARGFLRPQEYCALCDPVSPLRDRRACSRDPLQRLIVHIDAGTLCVRLPGERRLPLALPRPEAASPLLLAALARLVDDVEVWKGWWAQEEGKGDLAAYYVRMAEERVEGWERGDPEKARELAEKAEKRIEAIRAEEPEEMEMAA